jgi:CRP-like cAMP-binding protein
MSTANGWRAIEQERAEVTGHGSSLLAPLPPAESSLLFEHMERASLEAEQVLFEARTPSLQHVFFPVNAVVSLLAPSGDGRETEVATVGREGMMGLGAVLGIDRPTRLRAVVQMRGEVLRLDVDRFRMALALSAKLESQVHAYISARLFQISQNVVCAASHPVRQRLGRWLLQTADRSGQQRIELTHQFLADMLNVRRATVSEAIRDLSATGALRPRRGGVDIADRAVLEEAACVCYALVEREHTQLMSMS